MLFLKELLPLEQKVRDNSLTEEDGLEWEFYKTQKESYEGCKKAINTINERIKSFENELSSSEAVYEDAKEAAEQADKKLTSLVVKQSR
jgi:archaellum component FlaC